jgi:hypothetical protein
MKNLALYCLTLCATLLALPVAYAQPDLTEAMKAPPITLESGDLALHILPARAWTYDEIRYKGNSLTNPGSHSGLVFNLGAGKFVGSGHTEGGREQVQTVKLTVDGKAVDHANGGTVKGDVVELVKESDLAGTHLKSVLRLKNGTLECEQDVKVNEEIMLDQIYAFMFQWNTQTTHWMAKTTKETIREGDFTSADKKWELLDHVQWTSIYNPGQKVTALTIYPANSQQGEGIHHGYWNVHNTYHKQYYQPVSKRALPKDSTHHWEVKLILVPAEEAQWKEAVQNAVKAHS